MRLRSAGCSTQAPDVHLFNHITNNTDQFRQRQPVSRVRSASLANAASVCACHADCFCNSRARHLCEQRLDCLRIELFSEPCRLARCFPGMPRDGIATLSIAPLCLRLRAVCSEAPNPSNIRHTSGGCLNSAISTTSVPMLNRFPAFPTNILSVRRLCCDGLCHTALGTSFPTLGEPRRKNLISNRIPAR